MDELKKNIDFKGKTIDVSQFELEFDCWKTTERNNHFEYPVYKVYFDGKLIGKLHLTEDESRKYDPYYDKQETAVVHSSGCIPDWAF